MPAASASDRVEELVRRRGGELVELSHAIHAEPELAFAEHRSCAKAQALVAERGFEITTAAGGLDTAFRADYGSGPLVVGVCAEYDALPGIGHACGHNIIAASAVGTALALAEVADDLGLTVALLGTPAEESGGGKALMLQAGTFDDVRAVMSIPGRPISPAHRSLALSEVTVRYRGKESHAAVAPHLGVNAADAVTVAQVAIGVLRQQLAPGQMVHGIVTDGGQAVNVIPGQARLQYAMRAVESDSLRELQTRMFACFAAGALAAGCEYEIDEAAPAYAELKPDPWLADVCREEMQRLGREPLLPALEAELPLGSTDMGNVTQVLPGIHPVIGLDAGAATVHQRAFTVASAGASADRAVVDGAIMLARTVVRLAQTPDERDRVLAAQQRRAAR
ncbi:amidohydrolase amiB1 (aminohydrolase) [Mycobacterium tuberculosis GM 1503]|nr:amidohydrolase amiB1 (aminohydrolase) [Mycobacterium tuberculosis GM 1503]